MIITIDTNEQLTPKQKVSIAALLDFPGTDEWAQQLENGTDTSALAEAKPKTTRTRRTKAQMEAAEAERPIREETKAQNAASEAEQEVIDRAKAADERAEEEKEGAVERAKASAAPEPTADTEASIERLTEVAIELVTKNRQAMIELLERYGVKRASQVPADKRAEVIADIEAALKA